MAEAYEFQIETQILPSVAEDLGGSAKRPRLVQLRWEGNPLTIQMEVGDMVGHLNAVLTRIVNQRCQ
jgi:hypothetical protein